MARKKIIKTGDLLEETVNPMDHDMVFVTSNEKSDDETDSEKIYSSRLDRIRSMAIKVDEPLFTGETDLDLGKISLNSESDTSLIKKQVMEKRIKEENDKQISTVVDDMRGKELEDVVNDFDLDVKIIPIERHEGEIKSSRANSKAVQEILNDILKV